MAGGVRDTEATFEVSVNGVGELNNLNSAFDRAVAGARKLDDILARVGHVSASSNPASKMAESYAKAAREAQRLNEMADKAGRGNRAAEGVDRLTEGYTKASREAQRLSEASGKSVGEVAKTAAGVAKIAESYSKVDVATTRAQQQQARLVEYQSRSEQASVKAANAQERETAAIAKSVAQADKLASAREKDYAMARKYDAQTNAVNQRMSSNPSQRGGGRNESRIGGALKDAAGMFAPGMLLAGGVMSAADGVKNLFKSGWDNIKQTSAASAQWRTYTGSAAQGNQQAKTLQRTSLQYGQDFGLVNESARQIYMGLEGSNKVGRTNKLTKDVLKGVDAEGMSNFDAERFTKYAVGNAFDTGKVNKMALKEMSNYAPQMKDAWVKSLKADGKNVKNYEDVQKLAHLGKLTAEDLEKALNYAGSHEWKDASKNLLETIPGMLRVMKSGSAQFMGTFESSFMKPLGKVIAPYAKQMSDWFTKGGGEKEAARLGSKFADVTGKVVSGGAKVVGFLNSVYKATAPFRESFGKGFSTVAKDIGSVMRTLGNFGSKIKDLIPKGAGKEFDSVQKHIGDLAGKFTAIALALKGVGSVTGGLKGLAGAAKKFASKLPLIGKLFRGDKQNTAAGTMMKAATTMQSAADKMSHTGSNGDPLNGLDGGSSRSSRNGSKSKGWFARVAEKGEDMMGMEGGRVAARAPWWKKLLGKGLSVFGRGGDKALGGLKSLGGKLLGGRIGSLVGGVGKLGKFMGKGMPGLNALFAGFDLLDANATTKGGTKKRRVAYGSAIGGGIGATAGGALGSLLDPFIGPLGTIGGGIAGQWLGNKIGSFAGGLNFKKIGSNINSFVKPVQNALSSFGDFAKKMPNGQFLGTAAKLLAHPIKGVENMFNGVQSTFGKLKSFKMPDLGKMVKSIGTASLDKIKNPFKGWKIPKLTMPKFHLPKLTNPFKGWKVPKLSMPKIRLSKLTNPFKNWKMPKLTMPKLHLPKISNPFKGWKIPSLKLPSLKLPKMSNPFKDWKIPKLKMPDLHLPKLSNPFKNWKIPKLTMPSWLKNIGNLFKGTTAKASTRESKPTSHGAVKVSSASLKSVQSALNKIKNKSVTVRVKTTGAASIKTLQSNVSKLKSKSVSIRTRVSGSGAIKSLSNSLKRLKTKSINVRVHVASANAVKKLQSDLRKLKSKSVSVRARATGAGPVKALENAVRRLKGKTVRATAHATGTASVRALSSAINRVKSKTVTAKANVSGRGEVVSLRAAINSLKGKTVKVAASVSGTGAVRSLAAAINAVHSKSVTITANVAGKGASKLATGTPGARAAFASYASGTPAGGGHVGGLALVNDGRGSDYREAFKLPDGTVGLFPRIRNLMTLLPRGAHVLDALNTKRKFGSAVTSYATGTEGASAAITAISSKPSTGKGGGKGKITFAPTIKFGDIIVNGGDGNVGQQIMATIKPLIDKAMEDAFRSLLAKNSEEMA